jgi:uncharacterized protein YecE (DUF72 family)
LRIARWQPTADVWCIFDNTAAGFAFENALALRGRERRPPA